jgi:hypothetical protein
MVNSEHMEARHLRASLLAPAMGQMHECKRVRAARNRQPYMACAFQAGEKFFALI